MMRANLPTTVAFAALVVVTSACKEPSELTSPARTLTKRTVPATTTTTVPAQVLPAGSESPPTSAGPPSPARALNPADAVRRAIDGYAIAQVACLENPTSCDPSTFSRGPLLDATRQFVAQVVALHAYGRRNDEDPSYWSVKDVTISEDGTTAEVRACHWSTDILELSGGFPLNDERVTYHEVMSLVNEEGRWWIASKISERRIPGTNECAAKP
jgi:hypothetical protein